GAGPRQGQDHGGIRYSLSTASPNAQARQMAGLCVRAHALLRVCRESRTGLFRKEQTLQLATRIIGAHERLTDEEGIHLVHFHQLDVSTVEDATLSHHQTIARNAWQQVQSG